MADDSSNPLPPLGKEAPVTVTANRASSSDQATRLRQSVLSLKKAVPSWLRMNVARLGGKFFSSRFLPVAASMDLTPDCLVPDKYEAYFQECAVRGVTGFGASLVTLPIVNADILAGGGGKLPFHRAFAQAFDRAILFRGLFPFGSYAGAMAAGLYADRTSLDSRQQMLEQFTGHKVPQPAISFVSGATLSAVIQPLKNISDASMHSRPIPYGCRELLRGSLRASMWTGATFVVTTSLTSGKWPGIYDQLKIARKSFSRSSRGVAI